MLTKVKNVEVLFVTRDHYENPWLLPFPFQTYRQGALNVQDQINLDGTTSLTSYEKKGHMEAFKALDVKAYPTIIFVDKSTGHSLIRLEGFTGITADSVSNALLYINGLMKDGEGGYFKDGAPVFTSPLGLGILDIAVPSFVYLAGGVLFLQKAVRAKSGMGKLGFGYLSAVLLIRYFNS